LISGAAYEVAKLTDPYGAPFVTRTGRLIPNPLTNLPITQESDIHFAYSEADEGRALKLRGNGFAPNETLAEPPMEEKPFPIILIMVEPVKPGRSNLTETGDSASNDMDDVEETLNNAEVTRTLGMRMVPEESLQFMDESEIHIEDSQEHPDNAIICVTEATPKRAPITDSDTEPVLAELINGGELT